jgi:hypothetical protein
MAFRSSLTGLFWSIRGNVVCAAHVDAVGDHLWVADGWAPVPASSLEFHGIRYQCDACDHGGSLRSLTFLPKCYESEGA